jgi:hypothetical protein
MVEGGYRECGGCPLQSWEGKDRVDDLESSTVSKGKVIMHLYTYQNNTSYNIFTNFLTFGVSFLFLL